MLSVEELESSEKLYKVRVQVMAGGEPEERQVHSAVIRKRATEGTMWQFQAPQK